MSESVPEHVDIRGDPPIIANPKALRGLASFRIESRMYVHSIERLSNGTLVAYLGVSMAHDTTDGARDNEITFVNYAPVGAMYAYPKTIDGEQYYEVDLPDRDDVSAAIRARKKHENDHRAAVISPLANNFEDWADEHTDLAADADGETAALHRGMAIAFEIAYKEMTRRRDAVFRGTKRWSRDELDEVVDGE